MTLSLGRTICVCKSLQSCQQYAFLHHVFNSDAHSCDDPKDPFCISPGHHCSVLNILNKVAPFADRGEPGGWNDLDMLEVGQGGMSDEEYKAHFTMWALLKSPLLIGTNICTLSPSSLTILNNPAVIAINQDPLGRPARRVRVDSNVKKDRYGMGEAHVWTGPLAHGDQVVAFFNAADEDLEMEAGLDEIFLDDGPGGSAPQCKQNWRVYDLWSSRMTDKVARKILKANEAGDITKSEKVLRDANWYNATRLGYKEGLSQRDERLLGQEIDEIRAGGTLKATVPRHSVAAFRLRTDDGSAKRYTMHKEL